MTSSTSVDVDDESPASVSESFSKHAEDDARSRLDEINRLHLERMLQAERLFPVSLHANLRQLRSARLLRKLSGSEVASC